MKPILKLFLGAVLTATIMSCGNNSYKQQLQSDTLSARQSPPLEQPKTVGDISISRRDTGKTENIIFLVKNITEPSLDRSKILWT